MSDQQQTYAAEAAEILDLLEHYESTHPKDVPCLLDVRDLARRALGVSVL